VTDPSPTAAGSRPGRTGRPQSVGEQVPRRLGLLTVVLAVACGATVANIYYGQPLLDPIGAAFSVDRGTASLVVALTQIGYAIGLFFLVPLGDLLENRRLVTRLLVGTAAALLLAGVSPVFAIFAVASVLIGVTSVIVQVLVPLAAHLAPEGRHGSIVGRVMSGLLLGILLARAASSGAAELFGWRSIYLVAAAAMIVLSIVLRRLLPVHDPAASRAGSLGYGGVMRSIARLVREEPLLRRKALQQASMYGAFSVFWTAVAYELITEHGFSQGGIALFALLGAGGAIAAPIAGRFADRGHGNGGGAVMLVLAAIVCVMAGLGHHSLIVLAAAAFVLDFAVQAHQVMGQHTIYGLRPDARARINTFYMTTIFVGGAVASLIGGQSYARSGWTGACLLAAAMPLLGLIIWIAGQVRGRSTTRR
jgi:predicted MFS family arabinose efflux permease